MSDKKPWQHGYELSYLKQLEARFEKYNAHALGPFTEMKKNTIAQALHDGVLEITDDYIIETSIARTSTPIKCYLDVIVANKERGDRVISAFVGDRDALIERFKACVEPTWLWLWQEDKNDVAIAVAAGFKFVASKITSFSEIRGLYYNYKDRETMFPRSFPKLHPVEFVGMMRVDILPSLKIASARNELEKLDVVFENHYSNYNKNKAWSALSLRGYTADPQFITKPSEMNKRWQQENALTKFEMQDTALRAKLPAIDSLHKNITSLTNVHRIRLMQLQPGGGELQRHTDQTDKDSGVEDGKLMRFHYPIITNANVFFNSWDMHGISHLANMAAGEVWYLDTRKPHRAVNSGDSVRIHLVVDVEANDAVRSLLKL